MKRKIISMLMAAVIVFTTIDVSTFAVEKNVNGSDSRSVITENRTLPEEDELSVQNEEVLGDLEDSKKVNVQKPEAEEIDEAYVTDSKMQNVTKEWNKEADYLESTEEKVTTSGMCGDNLTWTLSNGTLTISGTGNMWDYMGVTPWDEYRESMTKLVIEEGVTSIGEYAFYECTGFKGDLVIRKPENASTRRK